MTALTACQSAAQIILGRQPTSFFASSVGSDEVEIAALANETAVAVAKAHDWRRLTTLKTMAGDASATSFALPSDYDRMLKKGHVHSSAFRSSIFVPVSDEDEWITITDDVATIKPGHWIILGGTFNIFPAMSVGETARFYYISNLIVSGSKTKFTADADEYLLSERLLTLGIIWRWRNKKGLDYAEDMLNFNIAQAEEISRDRGSRIIKVGRARVPGDVVSAYPGTITP